MAGVGEASQSENTSGVVGCRHYWVIDVADSRRSRGKCAHCGATKDFPNYFGDCVIDPDLFDRWVGRWDEVQGSAERLGGISGY